MEQTTIAALAATPPPKRQLLSVREAMTEIAKLENDLGLQPSKSIANLMMANARLQTLQDIAAAAEAGAVAGRSAVAPPVAVIVAPVAAATPKLTGKALFNKSLADTKVLRSAPTSKSNLKGRELFSASVKIDGSSSVAIGGNELAGEKDKSQTLTGRARFTKTVRIEK